MKQLSKYVINLFFNHFFISKNLLKDIEKGDKKDVYTLSSVFPNQKIMRDVKSII